MYVHVCARTEERESVYYYMCMHSKDWYRMGTERMKGGGTGRLTREKAGREGERERERETCILHVSYTNHFLKFLPSCSRTSQSVTPGSQ